MTLPLLDGVDANATVSSDGRYRYLLTREWSRSGAGRVLWIMLNPSTAAADVDDPTVRKCQKFARTWGFDGISVVNLFALRATDPKALLLDDDPVGDGNDLVTQAAIETHQAVLCAWGANRAASYRADHVLGLVRAAGRTPYVLGLTKAGHPRHPLYVRDETSPQEWTS